MVAYGHLGKHFRIRENICPFMPSISLPYHQSSHRIRPGRAVPATVQIIDFQNSDIDHLVGFPLGFNDIRHPAGNTYFHLFRQSKMIQTGAAKDNSYPFFLQGF